MNSQNTTTQVEKILSELEEIGSSANATIDIIFSSLQTNKQWDIHDVANCLVQKFPKKKFDIEFKIKTLFGEEIELKNLPNIPKTKKECTTKHEEVKTPSYEEIEQLKEMYEHLPQIFWSQVLEVAHEYKKLGEKEIFSPCKH